MNHQEILVWILSKGIWFFFRSTNLPGSCQNSPKFRYLEWQLPWDVFSTALLLKMIEFFERKLETGQNVLSTLSFCLSYSTCQAHFSKHHKNNEGSDYFKVRDTLDVNLFHELLKVLWNNVKNLDFFRVAKVKKSFSEKFASQIASLDV